jgi:hypothetical protein
MVTSATVPADELELSLLVAFDRVPLNGCLDAAVTNANALPNSFQKKQDTTHK